MSSRNNDNHSKPKRCNRARPLPPDVTARNLSIEKQRREVMNEKFLDLARLVPALALTRRLTKVLIINESIEHFRQQQVMCIAAAQDMQDLVAENNRLVSELNIYRSQIGQAPAEHKIVTRAMAQLMDVKDEIYGTFPAGFGDNWADDCLHNQLAMNGNLQDIQLSMDGGFQLPNPPGAEQVPPQDAADFPRNQDYQTVPFPLLQEAPYLSGHLSSQLEVSSPLHLPLFMGSVGSCYDCLPQGLLDLADTTGTSHNHQTASGDTTVDFSRELRRNSCLG